MKSHLHKDKLKHAVASTEVFNISNTILHDMQF